MTTFTHPGRRPLAALALLAALAAHAGGARSAPRSPPDAAAALAPLAPELDADRDGVEDALEDALLARFAPVVILHPRERALPSSAEWLLARSQLRKPSDQPRVLEASMLGVFTALVVPELDVPAAHLKPAGRARRGSDDPRDWTAYGHVFRGADGGLLVQYWFLYPFNDGYWAFDHEGDWEHVTVRVGADGRPAGVWYARHGDAMPGVWVAWGAIAREGERPVVLAARGTHASYARPDEPPPWDQVCAEVEPARAEAAGCAVWRTGDAPRGVPNLGERGAPREPFLAWPGRWGTTGGFGRTAASSAPEGPAFQPGWCSAGVCP